MKETVDMIYKKAIGSLNVLYYKYLPDRKQTLGEIEEQAFKEIEDALVELKDLQDKLKYARNLYYNLKNKEDRHEHLSKGANSTKQVAIATT